MTEDKTSVDLMDYRALHLEALRGVVRAALARAASPGGLPGDHHFYITFRTSARGVSVPDEIRAQYPEEMTIVLQHQFWDLVLGETAFSVTLQFGGRPKGLSIPYAAITRFFDPSVRHLIPLDYVETPAIEPPALREATLTPPAAEVPNVVSFDQFRKR